MLSLYLGEWTLSGELKGLIYNIFEIFGILCKIESKFVKNNFLQTWNIKNLS